jgi:hypothetical protein
VSRTLFVIGCQAGPGQSSDFTHNFNYGKRVDPMPSWCPQRTPLLADVVLSVDGSGESVSSHCFDDGKCFIWEGGNKIIGVGDGEVT